MAEALHRAIHDALRDSTVYTARGILTSAILEATTELQADKDVLYQAVYTLFCAMPWRLAPGTTFLVTTRDVENGLELSWEGREETGIEAHDLREVLRMGPHGDLVGIAFAALEQFCHARAGEAQSEVTIVATSPWTPRRAVLRRRVRIVIPAAAAPPSREAQHLATEG